MSWEQVYPYFTKQLTDLGCTEWEEPFDDENIPSTVIDRAFHQEIQGISGVQITNQSQETVISHEVRVHFKGFREPSKAKIEALMKAEDVVRKCIDVSNQTGVVKGVYFQSLALVPFSDEQNDNIIRAVILFDVRVFLCIK